MYTVIKKSKGEFIFTGNPIQFTNRHNYVHLPASVGDKLKLEQQNQNPRGLNWGDSQKVISFDHF